jgi:hypothetical protein
VIVERGADGDHLIRYGERASFWLSAAADSICCAPARPEDPAWQRFLLDTVLFVTSLLRGFQALHAGAVERDGEAVAFAATTGGGKTSIVAELVERGHPLFCDDILTLERGPNGLRAHPGPPLMNLPLARRGSGFGRQLADFGDEDWVAVSNASTQPVKPGPLFLIERDSRWAGVEVAPLEANPMHLVPHALGLERGPSQRRERFSVLADFADDAPLFRLRAGLDQPPPAIADSVLATLREPAVVL